MTGVTAEVARQRERRRLLRELSRGVQSPAPAATDEAAMTADIRRIKRRIAANFHADMRRIRRRIAAAFSADLTGPVADNVRPGHGAQPPAPAASDEDATANEQCAIRLACLQLAAAQVEAHLVLSTAILFADFVLCGGKTPR